MISRVSENMKFKTITGSLYNVQGESADLMEKISTRKKINRPSDDPLATSSILNYRSTLVAIDQYQTNISNAQTWLSLTDTNLEAIKDVITQAQEIATSQSSANADNETMDSSASVISSLIGAALSAMNAKSGDSYIFGGSNMDSAPFSTTPVGSIGTATADPVNEYDGTVTSGGTYTGTVNKNYAVKIIDGGTAADLSDATYQVSADGGTTWSTTQTDLSSPINFGDGLGVTLTFTPGANHTLAAGDSFTLGATASTIGTASAAVTNTFDGTVASGGTYTGTVNKAYAVKIINGGAAADLSDATYQVSVDGGATWGLTQTDLSSPINFGDGLGVTMTLTPGATHTLTAGDSFTVNATSATVGTAASTPVNSFDGTVTTSGTYTGTLNKTYSLQIITGGTLEQATYQVSSDGGVTWGATQTGLSTQITLGEGIKMSFTDGTTDLAANDTFTVQAIATSIGTVSAATNNTFNGTVTSGGIYTGTENKTYALKINSGGTLDAATYQVSTDGGQTWGTAQNFPAATMKGSVANTAVGLPITASTVWNTIDGATVQNGDTITISGTEHDGTAVAGTFTVANAATGTVQDLLSQIETTFGNTVTASIDTTGKITLTDNTSGTSQMSLSLTADITGGSLSFGTVAATTNKTVTLGDGITMDFDAGTQALAAGDLFAVKGYTAGYYQGNDDQLTLQAGKGNSFVYNITGSDAFTAANGPVAAASVTGGGTGLTQNDTITLTRGESVGSWTLTTNVEYPNMAITSQSAANVTIDADGDGTDDITLDLSGNWKATDTATFSVTAGTTGPPATTPAVSDVSVSGPGTVDLLTTLHALQTALESHDTEAVFDQIDNLSCLQNQVLQSQSEAGGKASYLETANTNLTSLSERITTLKSDLEDADLSTLIVSYQMEQIAMEATYNMAAKIGQLTIMDYL